MPPRPHPLLCRSLHGGYMIQHKVSKLPLLLCIVVAVLGVSGIGVCNHNGGGAAGGGAARYPSTLHACCTSLPPSLGIKWGVWAEWWGWNTRGQAGPTSRGGRGWVAAAALADVLALLDPTSMYAGCKRPLLVQGSHG